MQRRIGVFRRQCRNDRRIQSAGKEYAQRDIRDHTAFNRIGEECTQFLPGFVISADTFLHIRNGPVPLERGRARIQINGHEVSGGKLLHIPVQCPVAGDILERQEFCEGAGIFFCGERGVTFQCGKTAGEGKNGIVPEVIKWFHAQPVTGDQKTFCITVIQGKGKEPVEPPDRIHAFRPVEFQNDFGIGSGTEDVSFRFQFLFEFPVIEDLAVENNDTIPGG